MIARTDFPCGNGRINWIKPNHFEVEVIACSKGPRYACFRVGDIQTSGDLEVVLRPDRFFHANFSSFEGLIWTRKAPNQDWSVLEEERVQVSPEAIRIRLALSKGDEIYVSTEPARPYAETCRELFALANRHPEFARMHCIGHSIEERPLLLLRIDAAPSGKARPGKRPVILLMAGEHATEFAGEEIIRGVLGAVCGSGPVAEGLRSDYIFDFLLNSNPDGNFHGWHQYNGKDWREHNYADNRDRSWHHEFGPYFQGSLAGLSPETLAIGGWVDRTNPAFVLNAHSWLSHAGNPGAFRTDPATIGGPLGEQLESLDREAIAVSRSLGFDFEVYPSSNLCSGHLVDCLIDHRGTPGYAIEGHMNLGRERLQLLGARLIERLLFEKTLDLDSSVEPLSKREVLAGSVRDSY